MVVHYYHDDSYDTPREIRLNLPEGWRVASIRLTDSQGMDRRINATDVFTLEANSMALVEIEK